MGTLAHVMDISSGGEEDGSDENVTTIHEGSGAAFRMSQLRSPQAGVISTPVIHPRRGRGSWPPGHRKRAYGKDADKRLEPFTRGGRGRVMFNLQ
jgi:hypothetical protein